MGSYRLKWVPVGGGQLALGHRPGRALRQAIEEQGCDLVLNLLSERESRAAVGPHRIRLPLDGAAPPDPARDPEVRAVLAQVQQALAGGQRVYVHCSAGLHRTGMIAYALLRSMGQDAEGAVATIRELRALTADELTKPRIAWGERLVAAG